jgi:hypothetical protein
VIFLEDAARWLTVLHGVLGAAVVAVSTHLALWTRKWPRGDVSRVSGARWFASVGLGLYVGQFVLGNLLYPVYKVRVRSEYFDLGSAVKGEGELRERSRTLIDERRHADATHDGRTPGPPGPRVTAPIHLVHVSRTFDIKEHWAALGLPLAAAACAMTFGWRPKQDPRLGGTLVFVFAAGAALCAWIAGIIGLWVTTFRAPGGIG